MASGSRAQRTVAPVDALVDALVWISARRRAALLPLEALMTGAQGSDQ
jgi:hypothetical protein